MLRIYVGFDRREVDAWRACVDSLRAHASEELVISPISGPMLRHDGIYQRPESRRDGVLWDDISAAPMATEFSIARFFVPRVVNGGWALFCDCDFLFRADVAELFALRDERFALMCVQHPDYEPGEAVKMDGQVQTRYRRKNWSSLMLMNCDHPGLHALTRDRLNTAPGRDLHGFGWLDDSLLGGLPARWNWLEGVSDPAIEPAAVHYTRGIPSMPGYEHAAYAEEWRRYACRAAA